jgi:flagellar basal-body rod protein FlgG
MMRALSTAASGMDAQQTRLDVTANNIANVSTPGFKRVRAEFAEILVDVERTPGAATSANTTSPVGIEVGMGARTMGTSRLHSQGDMQQSENPLDLAIEGAGFFPIRTASGEINYTRDGTFKTDAEGRIVTSRGEPLAADITLPEDTLEVTISADGIVTARVPGEVVPVEAGRIELASFANPAGLVALGGNMYRETTASGQPVLGAPGENGTGGVTQHMLEISNVKIIEEMVDLIAGQRAYEVNARVIKAADEMLQQAVNVR